MRKLLIGLLVFVPALAVADAPARYQIAPSSGASVTLINAATQQATRNTGALLVAGVPYLAFYVDHTDANSSVTTVTMTCYSGQTSTTTSSTGHILQSVSVSAGVGTSSDLTFVKSVAGSKKWFWSIDTRGATYVICYFSFGGTPAAADLLTVKASYLTAP